MENTENILVFINSKIPSKKPKSLYNWLTCIFKAQALELDFPRYINKSCISTIFCWKNSFLGARFPQRFGRLLGRERKVALSPYHAPCYRGLCRLSCVLSLWKALHSIMNRRMNCCLTWTFSARTCTEKHQEDDVHERTSGPDSCWLHYWSPSFHTGVFQADVQILAQLKCHKMSNAGMGRSQKLLWLRQSWRRLFALLGSQTDCDLWRKDL